MAKSIAASVPASSAQGAHEGDRNARYEHVARVLYTIQTAGIIEVGVPHRAQGPDGADAGVFRPWAMNVSSGGTEEPMCDVNTTPLIDVMLVLLVMLIVTLPMQNHAVKLEMPPPTQRPAAGRAARASSTSKSTSTAPIVWSTARRCRHSRRSMRIFRRESTKDPQPEIHLRPDRGLRQYDVVANVMAAAQRANMVRMGFTNVAEFAE